MRLSFAQRHLLRRIHLAGGMLELPDPMDRRVARKLAEQGLLELARGFDAPRPDPVSTNVAISSVGRELVAAMHVVAVDTKPGRAPAPVRSRFTCSCGAAGDYTTPELANAEAEAHLEAARE